MAGHLVFELIKSGAELYEGEEAAHKPGWENKVKGTVGLAAGGLSGAGAVFGAGGALAMEAGMLGAGGAMAGAGAMMGAGGLIGGAGLAGFLAGRALDDWLGISDKMAGVTPGGMDEYHKLMGVNRQQQRGVAGLAADQKLHNPVAYLANVTKKQMNEQQIAAAQAHEHYDGR